MTCLGGAGIECRRPDAVTVIGKSLGPYSVVAKLGEGGMGEVYRGMDTRLGRPVALKVLPPATSSADALARFEREGRAIAALNHPNICTLFDVGSSDGRPFLVMELLSGASLQQHLAAGPLAIEPLIDHAIALADALHAAHAGGIIHRDLKPANVFITEQGTVKILDFGLAKADQGHAHESPTIDAALTGQGTTLGTLSYMSPEQLRGSDVDARSDLFSLGLVLYEMATARRAFSGRTFPEVSAAILHDEPTPPANVRRDLPDKLNEIILKLLEKERDLRYQSAAELRGDLKRLKRQGHQSATTVRTAAVDVAAPPSSSSDAALAIGLARRHPIAIGSMTVVALGAAAIAWLVVSQRGASVAPPPELSIQPLTLDGRAGHATISPDGRFIAYVHRDGVQSSVVVKQLSSNSDVVILPPSLGVIYDAPSVTPDGGFVDVLVRRRAAPTAAPLTLRVPFLGGPARQLVDGAVSGIGWSPDGQRMAYVRAEDAQSTSLVVADAQGQNARVLTTRRPPSYFMNVRFSMGNGPASQPSWSADGRSIAVAGIDVSPDRVRDAGELMTIDAESGAYLSLRRIEGLVWGIAHLATGDLVVSADTASNPMLWQWWLYPRSGSVAALTRSLNGFQGVQLTADRTSGVATQTTLRRSIDLGPVDGGAFREVVAESVGPAGFAAVDGRGHLFYTARVPSGAATFRRDASSGGSAPIAAELVMAIPSPDGTFVLGRHLERGLMRVNTDGSGDAVLLPDALASPSAFTPDGASLVYVSNRSGPQQPWLLPLAGGDARRLSEMYIDSARLWLSRDGREVIFGSQGGTRLCAFPGFDSCRPLKLIAGPLSADGQTVFAVDPRDPRNIVAQPIDGGAPTPLTRFTDKEIADFSLSPDRTQIAISRVSRVSDVVLIKGLQ
jgi:Tol biopolymer transport system component